MSSLCPQEPGITAPVGGGVVQATREITCTHTLCFVVYTAKAFTQGRQARRKTRRHLHQPSTWPETTDVPEEAGEMQVLDECRRVCLCHGQTGFSILSWPVSARNEPKI